jgi:hypothetical protein
VRLEPQAFDPFAHGAYLRFRGVRLHDNQHGELILASANYKVYFGEFAAANRHEDSPGEKNLFGPPSVKTAIEFARSLRRRGRISANRL